MEARCVRPELPPNPDIPSYESELPIGPGAARKQFQAIADKYPSTQTGKMARYFVGVTSAQLEDNATAERNLQEAADSSDSQLASLGKIRAGFGLSRREERFGGRRSLQAAHRQAHRTGRKGDGPDRAGIALRVGTEADEAKKIYQDNSERKSPDRAVLDGAAQAGGAEVAVSEPLNFGTRAAAGSRSIVRNLLSVL